MPRTVDATVGQRLPPYEVAVDAARMRTMAALLDDPVPIHWDVDAVRAAGLGDRPVNQGPMALGYLTELVARWTGDVHALARLRCRFHGNVLADDRLVCGGTVTAVDADAGTCSVDLVVHRGDDVVVSGSATVRLRRGTDGGDGGGPAGDGGPAGGAA